MTPPKHDPAPAGLVTRRQALGKFGLTGVLAALPAATLYGSEAQASLPPKPGRINVVVPPTYKPLRGRGEQSHTKRLTKATLRFIQSAYGGRPMPVWNKRPEDVDLEVRIRNIALWVVRAVDEHSGLYPVDPAWIMAQIMAESFFYEFAVSPAFAVGICQFIPSTARRYGMIVAGDKPEHTSEPYVRPELAGAHERYQEARRKRRNLLRQNRGLEDADTLSSLLADVLEGKSVEKAQDHLDAMQQAQAFDFDLSRARKDYAEFLQANFEGRSIFNRRDLGILARFDQRVTYRRPTSAMVKMMAQSLKARSGNIIAAAAAYNAGLGRTTDTGCYKPYGRLPAISETVKYVSRIFINHHEIVSRIG